MDEITAMLYELCSRLERGAIGKGYIDANPRLREWWEEHKKQNERRQILEKLEQLDRQARKQ